MSARSSTDAARGPEGIATARDGGVITITLDRPDDQNRLTRDLISRSDKMIRDFFLGFMKIHILHHAAEEPVYGLALIAELRRHGYELSPGTLYPVLHQLEASGYLDRLDRVVDGKVRRYYTLTRRGQVALADARTKIAELVGEVLGTSVASSRTGQTLAGARPGRNRRRDHADA